MYRYPNVKKLQILLVSVLIISSVMAIVVPGMGQCAKDPWYVDVDDHWAANYIYVLWSEGVTDGQIVPSPSGANAYFLPALVCTRGQFTVLMAKTFDLSPLAPSMPTYPDVKPSYQFLPGKSGWEHIEAASSAGITFTGAGQNFRPDLGITRQDAVELLIRSLDLYEYAMSMPLEEVNRLLNRFGDGLDTSPARRKSMACAIKLGIIEGYDDKTLRPKVLLLRSHAAAVMYRSCMIRVFANPNVVSPDGDGIDDIVVFSLSYLQNRGISQWNMAIEDPSGNIIRTFNLEGRPGSPPHTLIWNCTDTYGHIVPSGTYYYQAWVKDRGGRMFFSVKKPLEVVLYSLSGYLFPDAVYDGQLLTICCFTDPPAQSVKGLFADGRSRLFYPSQDKQSWTSEILMGDFLPLGTQKVEVTAQFGDAKREMALQFKRLDNIWIFPYVSPNPIQPGETLSLYCESSSNIVRVQARLFGVTVELQRSRDLWTGQMCLPVDIHEGEYEIVFTGYSGNRQVVARCYVTVGTTINELLFTLIQ
ncbi:MAG TPA: S-layer homology domain-containing protein [Bacillota bacterium]|nr:hypothetical protein [Candidatus Fermentithermobacillaceae bacterium]HOQ02434.1 S-layer homology domain-containing protein [Bacillota bacterium]